MLWREGGKFGAKSNLLKGDSLWWMNLRVELWNGLNLVIPALLFASKPSDLDGAHALLLSLECALSCARLDVLTHKSTVVCLWQFHWVKLGPEERNLRALTDCTFDILKDLMAVRPILFKEERCGIRTSLKVFVRIDSRAALRVRAVWLEADGGVSTSRRSSSIKR